MFIAFLLSAAHAADPQADEAVLVGVCDGVRVSLVAQLHADGAVSDLTGRAYRHDEAVRALQAEVLRTAATRSWFAGASDRAMEGTPFPRPFSTPLWNEPTPQAVPPAHHEPCSEECVVRLGPCDTRGAVLATTSLIVVEPTPVGNQHAIATFLHEIQRQHHPRWPALSVTGPRAFQAGPWRYVTASVARFDAEPERPHRAVGVFDPAGQVAFTLGAFLPAEHTPERGTLALGPPDATSPRWFRLTMGDEPRWMVVFDINAEKSAAQGVGVVLLDRAGVRGSANAFFAARGG